MVPPRKINIALPAILLFLFTEICFAQPTYFIQTTKENSPSFINGQGRTTVNYHIGNERIGKKIAIRQLHLIPVNDITLRTCEPDKTNCKDTYEAAFLYVELQSIWPEPVLITASKVDVITPKKNITADPGMGGDDVIGHRITKNWSPQKLLLQPGEVKTFGLSQGIKLKGVLDFFQGDVQCDVVSYSRLPFGIYYVGRVRDFNKFLATKYGSDAALRIRLFEKDYQPLLTTVVHFAKGTDFFESGDVKRSNYNLQHDGFIGEVLYQLRGGKTVFGARRRNYDDARGRDEDFYSREAPIPSHC